jgi:hypothetical protein
VTIQIPEDLPALERIAAAYPTTPTTVFREPGSHAEFEGPELPVVCLEVEQGLGYVQFFTYPDSSPGSLAQGLAISDVVGQLNQLVSHGMERELFWVSGLRPLSEGGTLDDAEASVRLCLPLCQVRGEDDPPRIIFVARSNP